MEGDSEFHTKHTMQITFLGTGTSQGVPVIACPCAVCASRDPHDKRLRTSALVRQGDTTVVIDAGPDFRTQMLREDVKRIDGLLLTHEHKDHTGGIDDVRAFNLAMQGPVDIYAEARVQQTIRKDFDYAFGDRKYPGAPDINLIDINEHTAFRVGSLDVVPIRGLHYRLPVLGFRIGNLAYLTDFNHIEDSEIEKIRDVDVLVVNALRHEPHLSHFTLDQALQLRRKVMPGSTYLTHISHQLGLAAEVGPELPQDTFLAYDGLTVEVQD